jgi:hypothetical protein
MSFFALSWGKREEYNSNNKCHEIYKYQHFKIMLGIDVQLGIRKICFLGIDASLNNRANVSLIFRILLTSQGPTH